VSPRRRAKKRGLNATESPREGESCLWTRPNQKPTKVLLDFKALPADRPLYYFELHIEQRPILEAENKTIGIVTGVQGMRWYEATIAGREAHSASTPMNCRSDSLVTAAGLILAVREIADACPQDTAHPGCTGHTGRFLKRADALEALRVARGPGQAMTISAPGPRAAPPLDPQAQITKQGTVIQKVGEH
jgi:acetylornithine deacetylase/succinyl-diaminopimelate desuccinylase-like protein